MKKITDKMLAERMLQAHKDGGYRYIAFLRLTARSYAILIIVFGLTAGFFAYLDFWLPVQILAGIFYGSRPP